MKKKDTNQFCLDILELGFRHNKALTNVVMALSSYKADSVVSLSESPVFHYQYSSITDAITHFARDEQTLLQAEHRILQLLLNQYWSSSAELVLLQTDTTGVKKPHSPTQLGRYLIKVPNQKVPGNDPLEIGCEYSFVNLVEDQGRWSLPLSARRLAPDKTASHLAAQQINYLLTEKQLPFHRLPLVVNTLDCAYASPYYLDGVKQVDNLVSIVRLRKGSKVYLMASAEEQTQGKCPKIYGQKFYLRLQSDFKHYTKHPRTKMPYQVWQDAILDHPADQHIDMPWQLKNGPKVRLQLWRWNHLLVRTKNGIAMKDKPFSLLCVLLTNPQDDQLIFSQPLFLAAFGEKQLQLEARQFYSCYEQRYGIEPFFRFAKRNLFLEKFQACSAQQLNNWMYIIILAVWLLFSARKVLCNRPQKWQTYLPREKDIPSSGLSLSQAYKAIDLYLLSFDRTPFIPLKSKAGPGRAKGQTQIPRLKYPYVKKTATSAIKPRAGPA